MISSVKAAYDLAKKIQKEIKDSHLQRTISDLLAQLNDVSFQLGDVLAARIELQQENERLRGENLELKKWNQQKEKYVLKQLGSGGYVYAPNRSTQKGEGEIDEDPYLCAACYKQGRESILQFADKGFDGTHYLCPLCKTKVIDTENRAKMDVWISSSKSKWDDFE
jgi:regulator of replication initiation timing